MSNVPVEPIDGSTTQTEGHTDGTGELAPPRFLRTRAALQLIPRALLGFDVFISYEQASALAYAKALSERLREQGLRVALDRVEFHHGDQLHSEALRLLLRSTNLVVLATDTAAASRWVRFETDVFAKLGRRIMPVVVAQALSPGLAWLSTFLYVRETSTSLEAGAPTSEVVQEITKSLANVRRVHARRRAIVALATGVLALGAATLTAYRYVRDRQQRVETTLAIARSTNNPSQFMSALDALCVDRWASRPEIEAAVVAPDRMVVLAQRAQILASNGGRFVTIARCIPDYLATRSLRLTGFTLSYLDELQVAGYQDAIAARQDVAQRARERLGGSVSRDVPQVELPSHWRVSRSVVSSTALQRFLRDGRAAFASWYEAYLYAELAGGRLASSHACDELSLAPDVVHPPVVREGSPVYEWCADRYHGIEDIVPWQRVKFGHGAPGEHHVSYDDRDEETGSWRATRLSTNCSTCGKPRELMGGNPTNGFDYILFRVAFPPTAP